MAGGAAAGCAFGCALICSLSYMQLVSSLYEARRWQGACVLCTCACACACVLHRPAHPPYLLPQERKPAAGRTAVRALLLLWGLAKGMCRLLTLARPHAATRKRTTPTTACTQCLPLSLTVANAIGVPSALLVHVWLMVGQWHARGSGAWLAGAGPTHPVCAAGWF